MDNLKEKLKDLFTEENLRLKKRGQVLWYLLRWTLISVAIGGIIGVIGAGFFHALSYVTTWRTQYDFLLYLLPVAGLLIALLYNSASESQKGTNLVIASIRREGPIPWTMAPLIFISTLLTHLCGGSAGREGAALQLGGSIAQTVGRVLKLKDKDVNIITMCGMSACFAALFSTPLAASVFCIEVVTVGIMHYSALVPCVLSAVTATYVGSLLGTHPESMHVENMVTSLDPVTVLQVVALGALCALVSILFCRAMHTASHLAKKIQNPYLRILAGSALIIAITLLLGNRDYNGAGMPIIELAVEGHAEPLAFLIKIVLTAITLGFGFKGGEIVPSFFVGATFGCVVGPLLGLDPGFAAALGLAAVFCGVTNCPIATLLLACELFGFGGAPYFFLVIAVCYPLSGYSGLYSTQRIAYSKTHTHFVNLKTN